MSLLQKSVGDGGVRGHVAPNFKKQYFWSKCHVKFGNFVIFFVHIFGQKCLASPQS